MTIISQSYSTLKKETSAEFARRVLLENLEKNNGNMEKTAREMGCSKNTIYLALGKQTKGNLADESHRPKSAHPRSTDKETVGLITKRRKETGFGKRRLRWFIAINDNQLIPESTIGKILKVKGLARKKQRVRREYHAIKYDWSKLLPFEKFELDTKEIADKDTLPREVYQHLTNAGFIPKWQWTIIDVVTRVRFLAWSYSADWSACRVFCKMVVWWLRMFGFNNQFTFWSDGGTELAASQPGSFQRSCDNFFTPLGVQRKIIRKGHPEDNPFVERSHQTDDFEFYIPHLLKVKSEIHFIKLGSWWQKVYNTIRPHMELNDLTPFQKLKSLGYTTPKEICLFPTLILDRLVTLQEVLNRPKIVQEHLDYDRKP